MKNDYLWDKTGQPDPDVQRLEELLGGMRFDRPLAPAERSPIWKRAGAVAAGVVVIASAVWLLQPGVASGWKVEVVREGRVHRTGSVARGQEIVTDAASRAKLELENFAEIEVEPNSRLRLVESRQGKAKMSLAVGVIHALVYAKPGNFTVATPAATAVDLGCAYTLRVDDAGDGLVEVDSGWVSFEAQGREVFIPAGAACATKRNQGPGIPYFEDSAAAFREAVGRFETRRSTADLDALLASARKDDAFTLWHVLPRVTGYDRSRVYDRLVALAPAPASVTREGVLNLNGAMMDALWDSFGLDDTTEWRKWKRPWRE